MKSSFKKQLLVKLIFKTHPKCKGRNNISLCWSSQHRRFFRRAQFYVSTGMIVSGRYGTRSFLEKQLPPLKCLHVHWKSNRSFVNRSNTTLLQELILLFPLRPTRQVKENRHLGYRLRYRISLKRRTLVELRILRAKPASQNTQR